MPTTLEPDQQAPGLDLPLVIGTDWSLAAQRPDAFTMIVFYRGLHCPLCKSYLKELSGLLDGFSAKGFDVVAVSMDDADRAETAHRDWGLGDLPVAHGLPEGKAREWGLWISEAISEKEARVFCEPGLFWIRPDGRLYLADVSNAPYARPDLRKLLDTADFVIDKDYPARGTKAAA